MAELCNSTIVDLSAMMLVKDSGFSSRWLGGTAGAGVTAPGRLVLDRASVIFVFIGACSQVSVALVFSFHSLELRKVTLSRA